MNNWGKQVNPIIRRDGPEKVFVKNNYFCKKKKKKKSSALKKHSHFLLRNGRTDERTDERTDNSGSPTPQGPTRYKILLSREPYYLILKYTYL